MSTKYKVRNHQFLSGNNVSSNNVSLALQFAPSTLQNIFGSGSISLDGDENTSDILDNTDWGTSGSSTAAESEESDADWILNGIMGVENDFSGGIFASLNMDEGAGGGAGDGDPDGNGNNNQDKSNVNNDNTRVGFLDNLNLAIGIADYMRRGAGLAIKQSGVIKFFSDATFSTPAETVSDFKLLTPTYKAAGRLFFWTGVGISSYQAWSNIHQHDYIGASKNGLDIGVSFWGLTGPAAATFGAIYFGIDATIGWPNAMQSMVKMNQNDQQLINMKVINYSDLYTY